MKEAKQKLKNNYAKSAMLIFIRKIIIMLIMQFFILKGSNFNIIYRYDETTRYIISIISCFIIFLFIEGSNLFFIKLYKEEQTKISDLFSIFKNDKRTIKGYLVHSKIILKVLAILLVFYNMMPFQNMLLDNPITLKIIEMFYDNLEKLGIIFSILSTAFIFFINMLFSFIIQAVCIISIPVILFSDIYKPYVAICKPELTSTEINKLGNKYVRSRKLQLIFIYGILIIIPTVITSGLILLLPEYFLQAIVLFILSWLYYPLVEETVIAYFFNVVKHNGDNIMLESITGQEVKMSDNRMQNVSSSYIPKETSFYEPSNYNNDTNNFYNNNGPYNNNSMYNEANRNNMNDNIPNDNEKYRRNDVDDNNDNNK